MDSLVWNAQDAHIILWGMLALLIIILLIALVRLPPFLAIMIGAISSGIGMTGHFASVVKSFSHGVGDILGGIGPILALGAMLGAMLAESGAADTIANALLRNTSKKKLPWIMALVAMIIGLPLFFEVGLVLMLPIIFVMAQRAQQPLVKIAIPALAGMTTLHALVPPHPGPLIAISAFHADVGMTMLYGLIIAIPAVICAGPLYGLWLSKRMHIEPPKEMDFLYQREIDLKSQPSLLLSFLAILLPVILMLGRTCAQLALSPQTPLYNFLDFLGEPTIALSIAVLFSIVTLGWGQGMSRQTVANSLRKSLAPIAVLLLTIGAGGGLKAILVDGGIATTISKLTQTSHMPILLLAWLVAVALRQATGSATVATTTSAGILAASVHQLSASQASLLALAIGAGSVFFCHVNDAGFWMIREYFGLKLRQTVMMWSILQTIVSVVGLIGTFVLWAIIS